jgi:hypothetical protein
MKRVSIPLSMLTLLFASCAATFETTSTPAAAPETAAENGDGDAKKIEELGRKLEVAKAKLEIARMERKAYLARHEVQLRHAAAEIEMKEARLARFVEVEAPNRLASEKLSLQGAKDRAQEAADELKQIEIMYEGQDLDDVTAEFVVSRGKRRAERTAAMIAIQEGELRSLAERELPQEKKRLEIDLDKAVAGLEQTKREGEIGRAGKTLALHQAELEVAKLEEELAELQPTEQP